MPTPEFPEKLNELINLLLDFNVLISDHYLDHQVMFREPELFDLHPPAMIFNIVHTTAYEYSAPAIESFTELRVRPRQSNAADRPSPCHRSHAPRRAGGIHRLLRQRGRVPLRSVPAQDADRHLAQHGRDAAAQGRAERARSFGQRGRAPELAAAARVVRFPHALAPRADHAGARAVVEAALAEQRARLPSRCSAFANISSKNSPTCPA